MQVIFNPNQPRRFWISLGVVLVLIILFWKGMAYFDTNLAKAREHILHDSFVISRIGAVTDTTLYKVRQGSITDGQPPCFAEYFFFVYGEKGGSVNLRVLACGSRSEATFKISER